MKVFLILIALIIAITLYKQKYLGKLAPIIIILSLLFITFRGHIEKLWEKKTEPFSGKDKLSKIEDNIVYSNFENFTFNDTNKELSDLNDLKLKDKFTVMAWVKQKEQSNDWVRIIGKGSKTSRNYGIWVKKDGQLLSQVYTGKYSNVRVKNSYLENDKWTHLAMTYNKDGRHRLYKNGKMIEAKDSKGKPLTDDEPLTIGGAEFHSKFKGEITGAVVLNTVISKEEVKHFAESPDKNLDEILGKKEKQLLSDPKSSGTGTLPVNEMVSSAKKGSGYIEYDPNISPSENINQFTQPPTLTKGLTTENVTPSPIYFAPGTVKYGGLGYKPSYEDINYMNNKLITKPEVVSDFNKRGFCDLENNIMENIDERCEKLPKDVCASTSCCVLLGDQRCVQGNKQGPTNKGVYSDTTIKNKDAYYYMSKCFGNCSDIPNNGSLPQEMPEMDAINPSPQSEM
jgi:hypothetical protein